MPNPDVALPKAVLLDRDGVINFDSPDYILTPGQWQAVPGSLEAIARLSRAGIQVAIVSNQSALGRGMIDEKTFEKIHGKMMLSIEEAGGFIDHVAYCPHAPGDGCNCRKPKPGMVLETLHVLGLTETPGQALFIGDSLRDLQAAQAAGMPAVLVESGYDNETAILEQARELMPAIQSFKDLAAAVDFLLGG